MNSKNLGYNASQTTAARAESAIIETCCPKESQAQLQSLSMPQNIYSDPFQSKFGCIEGYIQGLKTIVTAETRGWHSQQ